MYIKGMRSILITFILSVLGFVSVTGQTKNPSYEAYINKYKDLAIQHQQKYKIPASITLAQGILESRAGSSRLAVQANNHFGIKCKSLEEWSGGRIYHDDDAKNECFRAYKSVEDSYLDHSLFLSKRKYYVSLFDLNILDYKGWAHGLQKCGYATDKYYGNKLVNIIETYDLHKYDKQKVTEKKIPNNNNDDVYEIKLNTPAFPDMPNLRRRIFETNGVHYITAKKGDTYEIIAKETRIKVKKLQKYNDVTGDYTLKAGEMIYLQHKKGKASKEHRVHIVKDGESLHGISQIYGMKLKSVYKLNKLKEDFVPKAGDTLKVRK